MSATWRSDLDALSFQPPGHAGRCFIHRRAFRTLLGLGCAPTPEQCTACYVENLEAFQEAAAAKIRRAALTPEANFHLTSRDVMRTRSGSSPSG